MAERRENRVGDRATPAVAGRRAEGRSWRLDRKVRAFAVVATLLGALLTGALFASRFAPHGSSGPSPAGWPEPGDPSSVSPGRPTADAPVPGPVRLLEDLRYARPGPYRAGWRRVTVTPARGPAFDALVYYPAQEPGENAVIAGDGAPYPAVTFGHGFLQGPDRYDGTLAHLASWGFLVIATESQAGLSPDHAQFAADLSASLTYLEQSTLDEASWLQGQVRSDRFGASGHSMGGGSSILATAGDPRVRALANLAAADTRPSAVAAMREVRVPVHLIVGSEDAIVAPTGTRRMYDAGSAPRLFTSIVGGSHCGFQTNPFPIGCDQGSLPETEQLALTAHLLTAFFRLYLTDEGDWDAVWGPAAADPRLERTADPGARPTAPPTATALATANPSATTGVTPAPGDTPGVTITPTITDVPAPTDTPGVTSTLTATDAPAPTGPPTDMSTRTPAAPGTETAMPPTAATPAGGTDAARPPRRVWLPWSSCPPVRG